MLGKIKKRRSKARARRRIEEYNKKYRRSQPLPMHPEPLHVERAFDAFVSEFGGKKISEIIEKKTQMPLNADYLFEDQNVIAELKTLEGIYSGPNAIKMVSQAYIDAGCTGADLMGLLFRNEPMPKEAAVLIQRRIRRAIEQRIKQARKQLRKSKKMFGNKGTKLLILIAMDQQPFLGHKNMLFILAKIMSDNYADEHTDGVVYFNPNVPTRISADSMDFSGWYPFYRDDKVNDELSEFVDSLGNKWLKYLGKHTGETNPILKLESLDEMIVSLEGS